MFLKNLWYKILSLFNKKTTTTNKEYNDNELYVTEFERIDDINFNAIFSNKLSNYSANESTINVAGDNKRVKYLNDKIQEIWDDRKRIFTRMLGTGGVFIIPYFENDEIQYNLVPQFRVSINQKRGKKLTNITVLADIYTENFNYTTKKYYRWTDYYIDNGNEYIEQRYTDENGNTIEKPEVWGDIEDKISITNVDRITVGFFKSPIDNRQNSDNYGVPLTYGCEATIKEIKECLKQIVEEFRAKEVFIGVDYTLFKTDKDGKAELPNSRIYRKFNGSNDDLWEVFDPAIRESSYYNRLQELYARLEKEIGTSRGILTEIETATATATAIKKALYDTFTIVSDARVAFEKGMEEVVNAVDILANYYNITPQGDYEIKYSWGYDLLQDAQQDFNQLVQGFNLGIVTKEELRQWLKPEEDLETTKKILKEIESQEPGIEDIVNEDKEETEEE